MVTFGQNPRGGTFWKATAKPNPEALGMVKVSTCLFHWLWVKKRVPKKTLFGKRKHRPKPVIPKVGIFLTQSKWFTYFLGL